MFLRTSRGVLIDLDPAATLSVEDAGPRRLIIDNHGVVLALVPDPGEDAESLRAQILDARARDRRLLVIRGRLG